MTTGPDRSRQVQRPGLASNAGPSIPQSLNRVDTVCTTRSLSEVKKLTPQQYAEAVAEHARQTTVSSPFPGYNFENLATFLGREFDQKRSSHGQSVPRSDVGVAKLFPFVSIYRVTASGPVDRPTLHNDPSQFLSNDEKQSPSIVFLKGKPSSRWLSTIGASYKIDPEFINRHLDFQSTVGRIDYHSSPSFPSAQPMLLELPYITFGQLEDTRRELTQDYINSLRVDCANKMIDFRKALQQRFECDHGLGESIVRDFHLHDDLHFALQQRISIALTRVSGTWQRKSSQPLFEVTSHAVRLEAIHGPTVTDLSGIVIIWLDTGKPLVEGPDGPWRGVTANTSNSQRGRTSKLRVYPTIQIKPSIALRPQLHHIDKSVNEQRAHDNLAQSASLLPVDYGRSLDAATVGTDPFYALHDIFAFVAFSYRQYLNMLEKKDRNSTRAALQPGSDRRKRFSSTQWDVTNILYDRAILEDHLIHLRSIIDIVRDRDSIGETTHDPKQHRWPRAPGDSLQEQRAADAVRVLLRRFQELESQAQRLLMRYSEGMNVLMNRALVAEATKNLEQAKEVAKLTKIAFVFIPLSFTASFFGMNVTPINGSIPNAIQLWVWFAVSSPVLIISLIFMVWDVRDIWDWLAGATWKLWTFLMRIWARVRHGDSLAKDGMKGDDEDIEL